MLQILARGLFEQKTRAQQKDLSYIKHFCYFIMTRYAKMLIFQINFLMNLLRYTVLNETLIIPGRLNLIELHSCRCFTIKPYVQRDLLLLLLLINKLLM